MKKLLSLLMVILITFGVFAQPPQKMSYQCVVRNNSGALITNQSVRIRITILQGSVSGTAVYVETQTPTTNANGLVSIEIGGETGFDAIDWSAGPYFLKTETDPSGGTNYTVTGTSQILSVPYALHSNTAQTADYNNLTNKPNLSGYITTESDPLFAVSPAHGITNDNLANWNTAYGWGNHAGLYRSISWVPSWTDVTSKPNFATVATSGSYNDLINKPTINVSTDATLSGNGTTASPLKLAQQAATSGQTLKWNGTSWTPGTDLIGGSLWTQSGDNIYYNTGRVGIGTTTPGGMLNVHGISGENIPQLLLTENSSGYARLKFINTVPSKSWTIAAFPNASDVYSAMNFYYNNGTIGQNLMTITGNGNVGIGTSAPEGFLQIWGNSNTTFPQLLLSESEGDYARLSFKNTAATTKNWSVAGRPDPTDANSRLNFWYWNGTTGSDIMSITGSGKVGIGNVTPDATLDVTGTVQIGSSGKIFSEIREITGITLAAGNVTQVTYPSGYTVDNTRVLSLEIYWNGTNWITLGAGSGNYYVQCFLNNTYILVYYPDDGLYHSRAFRMLLMKVQ